MLEKLLDYCSSVHLVLMVWPVMQPASPGILGVCVSLCATVPPIKVTEKMAVEPYYKVQIFEKIAGRRKTIFRILSSQNILFYLNSM